MSEAKWYVADRLGVDAEVLRSDRDVRVPGHVGPRPILSFEAIDLPAAVVVAKFSTLPTAVDEDIWLDHVAMFDAVARALAGLP